MQELISRYYQRYKRLHKQLFGSVTSTILTLLSFYLLTITLPPMINWSIIDANWLGSNASDCTKTGACWVYISAWWRQLLFGQYPNEQLWRLVLCSSLFIILLTALLLHITFISALQKICLSLLTLLYPILAFILLYGHFFNLPLVVTRYCGD